MGWKQCTSEGHFLYAMHAFSLLGSKASLQAMPCEVHIGQEQLEISALMFYVFPLFECLLKFLTAMRAKNAAFRIPNGLRAAQNSRCRCRLLFVFLAANGPCVCSLFRIPAPLHEFGRSSAEDFAASYLLAISSYGRHLTPVRLTRFILRQAQRRMTHGLKSR